MGAEMSYLWGSDWGERLSRCYAALQMSVCIVGNVFYLIYLDVTVLGREKEQSDRPERFLVGRVLWGVSEDSAFSGEQLVVGMELGILICLLFACAFHAIKAACTSKVCERWRCVSVLFWRLLP